MSRPRIAARGPASACYARNEKNNRGRVAIAMGTALPAALGESVEEVVTGLAAAPVVNRE